MAIKVKLMFHYKTIKEETSKIFLCVNRKDLWRQGMLTFITDVCIMELRCSGPFGRITSR